MMLTSIFVVDILGPGSPSPRLRVPNFLGTSLAADIEAKGRRRNERLFLALQVATGEYRMIEFAAETKVGGQKLDKVGQKARLCLHEAPIQLNTFKFNRVASRSSN